MRFGLALFLSIVALCAQTNEDPEVTRAKEGIEKLRALVEAGAAPRKQLEQAQDAIADAEDAAVLRKTVYGQDLTAEQADVMIAAADRRLSRRQKAFDEQKKLVDAGVMAATSLDTFSQDLDLAQKERDLAESRARLTVELAAMAKAEEEYESRTDTSDLAQRYDGDGVFAFTTFNKVEAAFETKFGKPMPVSAMGETAVHRSMGFDHRGRVDVAIHPDQPEGVWLRDYLVDHHIPFFAFRHAVPGKATGAHIHIGPGSTRIANGG